MKCYSYLGRNGGEQELSLGRGCLYRGTVTHELLHAVGFFYEHSRSDRDDYIDIFENHLLLTEFLSSFERGDPSHIRFLTKFDYQSVMLYGSDSFSRGPGLPSMLQKGGGTVKDVYDKPWLSEFDIIRIIALYNSFISINSYYMRESAQTENSRPVQGHYWNQDCDMHHVQG
ncbi:astacin-like metalloprotease toxin 4 [Dermacentor andersoni]|uniref:astacin-like metalloprotease toxin 4 n=1 Tax=Dermacentor andersoni TaxID=34620 RepID=UPI003B3AC6FD